MRTLTHDCANGGRGDVVRDGDSYNVPVWRCQNRNCRAYYFVIDGETSQPSGPRETP